MCIGAPYLEPVLALVALQYLVRVYAHCHMSASLLQAHKLSRTVAEGIDRHQHVSNICLHHSSVAVRVCLCVTMRRGAGASGSTHVNLAILEALLQVIVDGLIGDLANQGKI
jgi:hypothetical protein